MPWGWGRKGIPGVAKQQCCCTPISTGSLQASCCLLVALCALSCRRSWGWVRLTQSCVPMTAPPCSPLCPAPAGARHTPGAGDSAARSSRGSRTLGDGRRATGDPSRWRWRCWRQRGRGDTGPAHLHRPGPPPPRSAPARHGPAPARLYKRGGRVGRCGGSGAGASPLAAAMKSPTAQRPAGQGENEPRAGGGRDPFFPSFCPYFLLFPAFPSAGLGARGRAGSGSGSGRAGPVRS